MSDTPAIAATATPAIGRGFRLQYEPAQKTHVLLYPEGMVKLNGSAAEILRRCDGLRTVQEIVADLEKTFGATDLTKDVISFIEFALTKRWVDLSR